MCQPILEQRRQRGAVLVVRSVAGVAVLVLLLAVPLWMKRERDARTQAAVTAEQRAASSGGAAPAPPTAPAPTPAGALAQGAAPRPISYGLSFAVAADDPKLPANVARLGCHGEPGVVDQPHKNSCNPYKGDTSCRVVLPILCLQPGTAAKPPGVQDGYYDGWTGGLLASTQPVMGAVLTSVQAASARCERELGPGWRMAEFHDGQGGWGLQGLRAAGAALGGNTRYWVHINDQPGNCWNNMP